MKRSLVSSKTNPSSIEMGEKTESRYATDLIRERTRVYKENERRSDGTARRDEMKEALQSSKHGQ